jgi:hypothetical protein
LIVPGLIVAVVIVMSVVRVDGWVRGGLLRGGAAAGRERDGQGEGEEREAGSPCVHR